MNDLLSVAVNAHGGLSWWHQLKAVKARLEQRATVTPLRGYSSPCISFRKLLH